MSNPNPSFSWPKGVSGNPKGRPKGKTMKEFAKEYLMTLVGDDKIEFMKSVPLETVWRMAEGNPSNNTDITSKGKQILVLPNELVDKNNDTSSSTE